MAWTKQTKATDSGGGLLQSPGFLVSAFLVAGSAWAKLTKATSSWTKRTKAT